VAELIGIHEHVDNMFAGDGIAFVVHEEEGGGPGNNLFATVGARYGMYGAGESGGFFDGLYEHAAAFKLIIKDKAIW